MSIILPAAYGLVSEDGNLRAQYSGNVLMHICCGPCSLFCIDEFRRLLPDAALKGLFANPNIHPYDEFVRRAGSTAAAADYKHLEVDFLPYYDRLSWEEFVRSDGKEQPQGEPDGERCAMCYKVRMELTAQHAKAHGFDAITSTLFVSPYQNHELLKAVCAETAEKHGLDFVYIDFRTGFRKGQAEAREIGLYRQKYCGCIRSERIKASGK
ncbi:MAG: epoxyqueuosine reductase QueH [Clostridia bacterium]|nr:epoxyqueuosine reductase QueH [Clostridia bacterium]